MVTVTAANYKEQVLGSKKPVLLDAWADWCGPCHIMEPIIQQFDQELGDQLVVAKLNVDEEAELAQGLGIMSMPTFLMIKDGQIVHVSIGARPKDALLGEITQHLGVKAAA